MEQLQELTVYESLKQLSRKQKKQICELQEKNEDLQKKVKHLLNMIQNFAKILGACQECWGDNSRCLRCHGKGKPGCFKTDRAFVQNLLTRGHNWWNKINLVLGNRV